MKKVNLVTMPMQSPSKLHINKNMVKLYGSSKDAFDALCDDLTHLPLELVVYVVPIRFETLSKFTSFTFVSNKLTTLLYDH